MPISIKRASQRTALLSLLVLATPLAGCGDQSTPNKSETTETSAAQPASSAPAADAIANAGGATTPAASGTDRLNDSKPPVADNAADPAAALAPPPSAALAWQVNGLANPESMLLDAATGTIYVSNVNGDATAKDGNGFISKLTRDGKIETLEWVKGLNAPKGMALVGNKLFVADIDQVDAIDVTTGAITERYLAPDAKFLNDVAADSQGRIYVSDMVTDTIWRLEGTTWSKWLESPALLNPNGLLIDGDKLIVAAWGKMTDGFATKVPGHLLQVSLADKTITALGNGAPVGNLDGIEADGAGSYLVTDWMAGKLFRIAKTGQADLLIPLTQGSADIGVDPATKTVFIPMMKENQARAYKLN